MAGPVVFVPMCADVIHVGHIRILSEAAKLGDVTVLLMTDAAMRSYKCDPLMRFEDRKIIVESLKQVHHVLACEGLHQFAPLIRTHKPIFFVHGDDWKTGAQTRARQEVIDTNVTLIEPAYTVGISSTMLRSALRE
jgi:phosphoenolpyruvate phosphomutase